MIRLCYADDNQQIRLTRYPFWSAENEILSGNKKKRYPFSTQWTTNKNLQTDIEKEEFS